MFFDFIKQCLTIIFFIISLKEVETQIKKDCTAFALALRRIEFGTTLITTFQNGIINEQIEFFDKRITRNCFISN